MLKPSPNHGTQRLPNDDDDDVRVPSSLSTCTSVVGRGLGMRFL